MADKKKTFTVTLPDGNKRTRTSTHDYQYVVACRFKNPGMDDFKWGLVGWCSRLDLAEKLLKRWQGYKSDEYPMTDFTVMPVDK